MNADPAGAAISDWIFDVTDFGATGDGATSDSAAVQAAVDAAAANGGGVVMLPAGIYRFTSRVDVAAGVVLQGVGWNGPGSQKIGTWIRLAGTGYYPLVLSNGSAVRDMAFEASGQTTPPLNQLEAIRIVGDNALVDNVFLFNVTRGINVQDCGRTTITRVWGQPLSYGIRIDNCRDAPHISNVHFWPFWNNTAAVRNHMLSNAVGIVLMRCDNPNVQDVFMLGYSNGIRLDQSASGVTSKLRLVNADLDSVATGVNVVGAGTTVQMSNVSIQSPASATGGQGITVTGANCRLNASNLRITDSYTNGIRIQGSNVRVGVENLWIQNWNRSGIGFPAFEIPGAGSAAWVGVARWFDGSGTQLSPTSKFTLA